MPDHPSAYEPQRPIVRRFVPARKTASAYEPTGFRLETRAEAIARMIASQTCRKDRSNA